MNHTWYRRRPLLLTRPHADHGSNKKHRLTALVSLLTATENSKGEEAVLFDLKRAVALFL